MKALCGSLLTILTLVPGFPSTAQPGVSGRWALQGAADHAMDSVIPAWEEIAVEPAGVTITRGTRPPSSESYTFDETDRQVTRVRSQLRVCRAGWTGASLVISCRQSDRGPGGRAPDIVTHERRTLDDEGRMVLETRWRSGAREVVRQFVFVRVSQ
jgi:hypothetical protein